MQIHALTLAKYSSQSRSFKLPQYAVHANDRLEAYGEIRWYRKELQNGECVIEAANHSYSVYSASVLYGTGLRNCCGV